MTVGFVVVIIITILIKGQTSLGVPYYGIGVFMPIMMMGLAIRQHILRNFTGRRRFWGNLGASFAGHSRALYLSARWLENGQRGAGWY